MNCIYIHNRKENGPKESTWFAFNYITKEMEARGHFVDKYSVDYGMNNIAYRHWSDEAWAKADMLFTVHKNSYGPLLAAKKKGIPSFLEIGFACPETAMNIVKSELSRNGFPQTEIRGDIQSFGKEYYDLPTYVVGVGNEKYTLKSYLDFGIRNVKLFNLGIDFDLYKPNYSARGKTKIKFTFTASLLSFRKGVYYLVSAWRKLPKALHKKIELHITGLLIDEIMTKKMIFDLVKDFDNVFYHGFIYNQSPEYLKIHAESDVMILPTLAEGQAATVLEGLSFGLFPIVSPFTGTNVEEFPSRVLGSRPDKWIDEIITSISYVAASYKKITSCRTKIRDKIIKEYRWDSFAKKEVDFIEEVVAS